MPISLSDDDDIWTWIFKSNRSAQVMVRGDKPLSPLPSSKAREYLTPAEPSNPREASSQERQADERMGVYDSGDAEQELTVNETESEFRYPLGSHVYVEYRRIFYSAKVVKRRRHSSGLNYLVHYEGFKKSSDTWVKESLIHVVNTATMNCFEEQRKSNNDRAEPARVSGCTKVNRARARESGASADKTGRIAKVTSADQGENKSSVTSFPLSPHSRKSPPSLAIPPENSSHGNSTHMRDNACKLGRAGRRKLRCSFDGCTSQVQQGGLCIGHGAIVTR
jgi:hypothetical protein